MTGYIIRRLLWLIPVLFFVSLVTFVLMHSINGGPWDVHGSKLSDIDRARLNARYGLDDPVWKQYLRFAGNSLKGDLGVSFRIQTKDVRTIIWDGAKVSFVLGALSMAVSLLIGVPLGVISAVKKNGIWDYVAVGVSTIGASVPSFVMGIYLILFLAVKVHWFPVQGWGSPREAVLPTITMAVLPLAYIARITRASVLEVLNEDYIRTARAKGLANWTVLTRHVMRNALIPILTILGPLAAAEVTGSFIVENMFGIPGVGRQFVSSILSRDYGVIMGTTLFYAVLIVMANLMVDLTYAVVDPRIRRS